MRYAVARHKAKERETAYRIYITDGIKCIAENTARYVGGQHLTKRYIDIIDPKPEDERSGDEIAADVITRLGLKFSGAKGGE